MRMPDYGLEEWKDIVDCVSEDDGNTIILWTAGAFRSEEFPMTWQYNRAHRNVQQDFVRLLIDYAHTRNIRVLLGFTPFGYDGVNQYHQVRPDLVAVGGDGHRTARFGIHSWGYSLCASREPSQQFMFRYIREMFFDFYPNADGLLIESSDYSVCECPDCSGTFFDQEFKFVRAISDDVWKAKPEATIIVYPRYFSSGAQSDSAAKERHRRFDPRWTLFFTPHSARLDPELIRGAKSSLWWDDSPALRSPGDVQRNAQLARDAGVTGYVPSLETFSYLSTEAEEGQAWLKDRRQIPLGMAWLRSDQHPYRELPIRVQRIAYRAFAGDPDLSNQAFRCLLGQEILGEAATEDAIDDLLLLQSIFASERTWYQPSPVVSVARCRAMHETGQLTAEKRAAYRTQIEQLRLIAARNSPGKSHGQQKLAATADWVVQQWSSDALRMLQPSE